MLRDTSRPPNRDVSFCLLLQRRLYIYTIRNSFLQHRNLVIKHTQQRFSSHLVNSIYKGDSDLTTVHRTWITSDLWSIASDQSSIVSDLWSRTQVGPLPNSHVLSKMKNHYKYKVKLICFNQKISVIISANVRNATQWRRHKISLQITGTTTKEAEETKKIIFFMIRLGADHINSETAT